MTIKHKIGNEVRRHPPGVPCWKNFCGLCHSLTSYITTPYVTLKHGVHPMFSQEGGLV